MAFDGSEGGQISLDEGANMTSRYREENPNEIKGHFFGKDILKEILNQDGCMGIRMYYGINEKGEKELVIVGADSDQNDMLEIVGDISLPCPSRCGNSNGLNS